MCPEDGQAAFLRIQQIVQLVDAAEDRTWHNLPQAKVRFPARSFHRSIIVQPLDRVG